MPGEHLLREGDHVRFKVSDVFLPPRDQLYFADQEEMEGVIMQFSDSGGTPRMFASVAVVIHQTVVIPVRNLQPIAPLPPDEN